MCVFSQMRNLTEDLSMSDYTLLLPTDEAIRQHLSKTNSSLLVGPDDMSQCTHCCWGRFLHQCKQCLLSGKLQTLHYDLSHTKMDAKPHISVMSCPFHFHFMLQSDSMFMVVFCLERGVTIKI